MTLLWLVACADGQGLGFPSGTDSGTGTSTAVTTAEGSLALSAIGAHGIRAEVTLSRQAGVTVACSDEAGTETHRAGSPESAASHTVDVYGLLADTAYACTAVRDGGSVDGLTQAVRTTPEEEGVPRMAADGSPTWGAYTAFLAHRWCDGVPEVNEFRLLVVDPEGRVRWDLQLPGSLLPDVDVTVVDQGLLAGGGRLLPTLYGQDGAVRYVAPDDGFKVHHHAEPLEEGHLTLLETVETDGGLTWPGLRVQLRDPATDVVTWSWDTLGAVANADLPRPTEEGRDFFHGNAAQWVDDTLGPALWISLYGLRTVVRVDRATGRVTHTLGEGGDVSLLDEGGEPLPESEWFHGTHNPRLHGSSMWLYDNAVGAGDSRVLRLDLDLSKREARRSWSWTEPRWKADTWGDVDLLDSGAALVTIGECAYNNAEHNSAIVEVDPSTDAVRWRLDMLDVADSLYRAHRVDGCALFGNERYCP